MIEYKVDRVFVESLEEDLKARANEGWKLVTYAYVPTSASTLLVTYEKVEKTTQVSWTCGCGNLNINYEPRCTLCNRPRR